MSEKRKLFATPRRPYYIVTPDYLRQSAGIRVMHLLCHALNLSGEEAYVITGQTNPKWRTPVLTAEIEERHRQMGLEPIAVYPEVVAGNPLRARLVVRYILNYPGLIGGSLSFDDSDLLFFHHSAFAEALPHRPKHILFFPVIDSSLFNNEDNPDDNRRKGSLVYAGRDPDAAKRFPEIFRQAKQITYTWPASQEEIAQLFRKHSLLYCFASSAIAAEAMLCGCPVVLMPSPLNDDYIRSQREQCAHGQRLPGFALDNSPAEVAYAKATVADYPRFYATQEAEFWQQLDNFIALTQAMQVQGEAVLRQKPGAFRTSGPTIHDYHHFLISHRLTMHEAKAFDTHFAKLDTAPTFEIVVVHNGDEEPLVRTFSSAARWLYDRFHLTVLSTVDAPEPDNDRVSWTKIVPGGAASYWPEIARCLEKTEADWVMVLEAGDELVDHGLLYFAERALRAADSVVLYADEDTINAGVKPDQPYLKPDFSPDYFLAFDYLGDAVALKRSAIQAIGGLRQTDNDPLRGLLLRLHSRFGAGAIGHIPDVLLHRCATRSLNRRLLGDIIEPALHEVLPAAQITPGLLSGGACIDYPVENAPSILMIAKACTDLPTLQRFVEQTWLGGGFGKVELALLAAPGLPENVRHYLQEINAAGHKGLTLRFDPPGLESTGRVMAAITNSSAELVLLVHPEIEPADSKWIERLAGHATRPAAGVIAPRLINRDGRLIGNALLLGMDGFANALGHGEASDAPGYFGRLLTAQNPSALAPEVVMFSRAALDTAGGIDTELSLTAALIDLSLRCKKSGRDNLWTPDVTLACRFETPGTIGPNEQELLLERWLPQMARDPAYNVNLSRSTPFALHDYPQISKLRLPWKPLPRLMAFPADDKGCGHYRVIQPFDAAQGAGLIDGYLDFTHYNLLDVAVFEPDTLFLQRQLSDAQFQYMRNYRRLFNVKVVYDLDDMITNLPVESLHRKTMPKDVAQRLRKGLELCDRFVVTTEALKDAYRGLIDDIRVIPNYIDRDKWGDLTPRRRIGEKPRVGWAGGMSHTGDLALVADLVKATAHEVDWIFFGYCIEEIKPHLKEFHPGVLTRDYPAKLASLDLDLAIAPIAENDFNDCKSNLKLLEYGILGYPVIASNFGPYRRSKDFPVTLVKNRHKDWLDALYSHIHDLDAAAHRGDALREHVRQHWILQNHLDEWRQAWFDFPASQIKR